MDIVRSMFFHYNEHVPAACLLPTQLKYNTVNQGRRDTMIYDKLTNLPAYRGLSPALDTAIAYLCGDGLHALPQGRTDVDREEVFINHFGYVTGEAEPDALFEAHAEYWDLHILLQGSEYMAVAPLETLTEKHRCTGEDSILYAGTPAYSLPLDSAHFVLVAPGEGHMTKLACRAPCTVDKLVCKVRVPARNVPAEPAL